MQGPWPPPPSKNFFCFLFIYIFHVDSKKNYKVCPLKLFYCYIREKKFSAPTRLSFKFHQCEKANSIKKMYIGEGERSKNKT